MLLTGCSVKEAAPYGVQIPYRILLITPAIRFNDTGFVKHNEQHTLLELYTLGKPFYKIDITKNSICLQDDCYNKGLFMQRIFGSYAYAELLEDILLSKDIYNAEGIEITTQGKTQIIKRKESIVVYKRGEYITNFTDSTKSIKIILDSTPF